METAYWLWRRLFQTEKKENKKNEILVMSLISEIQYNMFIVFNSMHCRICKHQKIKMVTYKFNISN